MKITFTDDEFDQLLELLRDNTDACTDEEVALVNHFIKKLQNAQIKSWSNKRKLRGAAKDTAWDYHVVRPVKEKLDREKEGGLSTP